MWKEEKPNAILLYTGSIEMKKGSLNIEAKNRSTNNSKARKKVFQSFCVKQTEEKKLTALFTVQVKVCVFKNSSGAESLMRQKKNGIPYRSDTFHINTREQALRKSLNNHLKLQLGWKINVKGKC